VLIKSPTTWSMPLAWLTGFQIWDMRSRFSAILSNNNESEREKLNMRDGDAEELQKLCRDRPQKNKKNLRNINSKQTEEKERESERERGREREAEAKVEAQVREYIHKIFYMLGRGSASGFCLSYSYSFRFGFRFGSIGRATRLPNLLLLLLLLLLFCLLLWPVCEQRSLRFCFSIHEIPGNL